MNKGGFSWKRLTGVSRMKSKISRATGVPLTKSGRQRKIGKVATGGGCLIQVAYFLVMLLLISLVVVLSR